MPRFSANLTMLWPELDVYDRFAAAAAAGFKRVEILFVHALDHERVAGLLREHGLELVLFDPAPGDWDAGERGLLSLPGREAEFQDSMRNALAAAHKLGTRRLNAMVGVLPPGISRAAAERTAIDNLQWAAPLVAEAGVLLLVEGINTFDFPGYFADTVERAAALVTAADRPHVRLQLDQYHVGMMGDDALDAIRRFHPIVEHVQIADVPGRHEPGTGQQPIAAFLAELDRLGYGGAVGLEYRPSTSTDAALDWLPVPAARLKVAASIRLDPARIAQLEAGGWRAYYDRNWPTLVRLMVQLNQEQFHIPFPLSVAAAFHVARASVAWGPIEHDEDDVRRQMRRFYRMARRWSGMTFVPEWAAALEVDYWVEHRRLLGQADKEAFIVAMTALHSHLFSLPAERMRESAEWRVKANNTVDLITGKLSTDEEADWAKLEDELRQCYASIQRELDAA